MSAGDGSSAGVCASPEAQTVPHVLSRWAAAVYLFLLGFFKGNGQNRELPVLCWPKRVYLKTIAAESVDGRI